MKRALVTGKYILVALIFTILGATASFGISAVSAQVQNTYPVGMLHWNGTPTGGTAPYSCDAPYTIQTFTHLLGRYGATWYDCQ